MDVIAFLKRSERKNIQHLIGVKVKQKLLEYENTLNERRQRLKEVLELENAQLNEELVLLLNEKLNDQRRNRMSWTNTKYMERIQAEEQLLEVKRQQRQLDNCEAWRHFLSKQLLLDSKTGQLYQIEDKKLRLEREKNIDKIWHDVMHRLNNEREYQEIYAGNLHKVIERTNQFRNEEIDDNNKKRREQEGQQTKREFQEENRKSLLMEQKLRKDEQRKEFLNKVHQDQVLKFQISANQERKTSEEKLQRQEVRSRNEVEERKIISEVEANEREKIYNNEWQRYYLKKSSKEKQLRTKEEKEYDRLYVNTGCVLQQRPKKPYGKAAR